jgi:hypothetical protein
VENAARTNGILQGGLFWLFQSYTNGQNYTNGRHDPGDCCCLLPRPECMPADNVTAGKFRVFCTRSH